MGVKGLWDMVSPTGELVGLASLAGQAVAVDLASWLVDTQTLQLEHMVTRPHLRNLFFRTVACLEAGLLPVMVLEGEAPSLKWDVIDARNNARNPNPFATAAATAAAKSTTKMKRSRFNAVLKKCGELFDLLGVPWVYAVGEAEATCAAFDYHQVVAGVITQDSDVFLYGGNTVFRNFTASGKKLSAEKYSMKTIEERLHVSRGGMMLLAVLLGCDYLPGGVYGVGRDTALKFIRETYAAGDRDPSQRLKQWAEEDIPQLLSTQLASTKWKKGTFDVVEDGLKKRLVATDGFPFNELLAEFRQRLPQPLKKVVWTRPDFEGLLRWCVRMLDWEVSYAMEKVAPVVTRWTVMQGAIPKVLQPVKVVKQCVRRGVASLQVEWEVGECCSLPPDVPQQVTTDEPLHLLRTSLPHLVQQFEDMTLKAKKGKSKSKTKKTMKNKENICQDNHTITEYFKEQKPRNTTSAKKRCESKASNVPNSSEVKDAVELNRLEKQQQAARGSDVLKTRKKHSKKDFNQHKGSSSEAEELEDEELDSETDERELSLIIDKMMNMDVNVWNKLSRSKITKQQHVGRGRYELEEACEVVKELDWKSGEVSEAGSEGDKDTHEAKTPSLYERASRRLKQNKKKKQLETLQNYRTNTELCSAEEGVNKNNTERTSASEKIKLGNRESEARVPRIDIKPKKNSEGQIRVNQNVKTSSQQPLIAVTKEGKKQYQNASTSVPRHSIKSRTDAEEQVCRSQNNTSSLPQSQQPSVAVSPERKEEYYNESRDMFDISMGEDTLDRMFEDTMSADTLDSSLPDMNKEWPVKSSIATRHSRDQYLRTQCSSTSQGCGMSVVPSSESLVSLCHKSGSRVHCSSTENAQDLEPKIHYTENDKDAETSPVKDACIDISDSFTSHVNIRRSKKENTISSLPRSVSLERIGTGKSTSSLSPSVSSHAYKPSQDELTDVSVKLSSMCLGAQPNKHTTHTYNKDDDEPSKPLPATPILKKSFEEEGQDSSSDFLFKLVLNEESNSKEKDASLGDCYDDIFDKYCMQDGGGHDSHRSCAIEGSENVDDVVNNGYSTEQGTYQKPHTLPSLELRENIIRTSIENNDNDEELSAKKYLHQSSLSPFCSYELMEENRDGDMDSPAVSLSSTGPSPSLSPLPSEGVESRPSALLESPSFCFNSPVVSLTLAQRLRLKYPDKRFGKLLDDLG